MRQTGSLRFREGEDEEPKGCLLIFWMPWRAPLKKAKRARKAAKALRKNKLMVNFRDYRRCFDE
jgi:hypothetical protein